MHDDASETIHTAMFPGDDRLAGFIFEFIQRAVEVGREPVDGEMFAWCIKAAYDGEQRKAQYKFMTMALRNVLGPQEWDLSTHRRNNDTGIIQ